MYATHHRLMTEEFAVAVHDGVTQMALGLHLPCGIAIAAPCLGTGQLEGGAEGGTHVVKVRHDIGTLRGEDGQLGLGGVHGSDVRRRLDHAVQLGVLADGVDAIVDGLQSPHEATGHVGRQDALSVGALHGPHHLLLSDVELVGHVGGEDVPVGLHILLQVRRYADDEHAVAGYGVVQLARVELCQAHTLIAAHGLEEEAPEELDGVGTLLVDVVARVSADESLQLCLDKEVTLGCLFALEGEASLCVASTGTADENLAFVL